MKCDECQAENGHEIYCSFGAVPEPVNVETTTWIAVYDNGRESRFELGPLATIETARARKYSLPRADGIVEIRKA